MALTLTLRLQSQDAIGFWADELRPDTMAGLSALEVARLPVWVGNRTEPAGEVFAVEGDATDGRVEFEGDCSKVSGIGQELSSGRIIVRGHAGHHLGAKMRGGVIQVDGSAGDWAGAEMRGGLIQVAGSAASGVGAAYPGSRVGVRDGAILVAGDVGHEAGLCMRRGLIAVGGSAGDDFGRAMVAGSLFAFGAVGKRVGAGMKRGTIVCFGKPPEILPTFRATGRLRPHFVTIYLKWLRERGAIVPDEAFSGAFDKFNGDLVDDGQGEILIWRA
jgi:formylmethanofuran dehydrogenase subunit C